MKKILQFTGVLTFFMVFVFSACKEEDHSQNGNDISGFVQKGPFVKGSSVTMYELNSDLSQTGNSYNTQITDVKGTFVLKNISTVSNLVCLKADGYYFNEVTGEQTTSPLTLYAISDISDKNGANINILTHLEKARVEYLVTEGTPFQDAKNQAQKEILAIFNIEKEDMINSESLDISKSGEDNGILLAISSIIQGYRSESELTELLSNISNDINEDGTLDNKDFGSALINHAVFLNPDEIMTNLASLYSQDALINSSFPTHLSNFISNSEFPNTGSIIEYPDYGLYGKNILSLSSTVFTGELPNWHSFAANLPKGISLKIRITSLCNNLWYYSMGSNVNMMVSDINMVDSTQLFRSIRSGASCDLQIFFKPGTFLIEYFENNAETPNRSKTITVN